jgi:hypothetical protein
VRRSAAGKSRPRGGRISTGPVPAPAHPASVLLLPRDRAEWPVVYAATRTWSAASVQTAEESLLKGRRAWTSVAAAADRTSVTESALVCPVKECTLLCFVVLELWTRVQRAVPTLDGATRAHPELLVRFRIRLVRLLQVVVPPFLQLKVFFRACGGSWSERGRSGTAAASNLRVSFSLSTAGDFRVSKPDLGAQQLALLTVDLGMSFASDRVALSFKDRDALAERGTPIFSCRHPFSSGEGCSEVPLARSW